MNFTLEMTYFNKPWVDSFGKRAKASNQTNISLIHSYIRVWTATTQRDLRKDKGRVSFSMVRDSSPLTEPNAPAKEPTLFKREPYHPYNVTLISSRLCLCSLVPPLT